MLCYPVQADNKICLHFAYRFFPTDHSMQQDHIGVSKLSHDGCLLQELDLVSISRQGLHCDIYNSIRSGPATFLHIPKLTRP